MKLMLSVIFACIGAGLLARRLGTLEHVAIVVLATAMTALYFLAARFM